MEGWAAEPIGKNQVCRSSAWRTRAKYHCLGQLSYELRELNDRCCGRKFTYPPVEVVGGLQSGPTAKALASLGVVVAIHPNSDRIGPGVDRPGCPARSWLRAPTSTESYVHL